MISHLVVTGPESTGKTTLAVMLSSELGWPLSEEVARNFIADMQEPYSYADVQKIGKKQHEQNLRVLSGSGKVVADTDLLTILIWMTDKFGKADDGLHTLWLQHQPDLYLLQSPDMPWEPDPLREDPDRREELFQIHLEWLEQYGCTYQVLGGRPEERLRQALRLL